MSAVAAGLALAAVLAAGAADRDGPTTISVGGSTVLVIRQPGSATNGAAPASGGVTILDLSPAASTRAAAPADPDLAGQKAICFPDAAPKEAAGEGLLVWSDEPAAVEPVLQDGRAAIAILEGWFGPGRGVAWPARRLGWPCLPPATAASPNAGMATANDAEAMPPIAEGLLARADGPLPSLAATGAAVTRPAATRPVAIAVYARAEDYRALWPRVGRHYGGQLDPVTSAGFSYRAFCATSYGGADEFARVRPVVAHELTHVWLYQRLALVNDGNWLTEGVASAVQLRLFPQSGDRRLFADAAARGRMLPLKRLMDQPRLEPKDYWQAATLWELLAARWPERLAAVVEARNAGLSAYRIVADVLQTDAASLQKQWEQYVEQGGAGP